MHDVKVYGYANATTFPVFEPPRLALRTCFHMLRTSHVLEDSLSNSAFNGEVRTADGKSGLEQSSQRHNILTLLCDLPFQAPRLSQPTYIPATVAKQRQSKPRRGVENVVLDREAGFPIVEGRH